MQPQSTHIAASFYRITSQMSASGWEQKKSKHLIKWQHLVLSTKENKNKKHQNLCPDFTLASEDNL